MLFEYLPGRCFSNPTQLTDGVAPSKLVETLEEFLRELGQRLCCVQQHRSVALLFQSETISLEKVGLQSAPTVLGHRYLLKGQQFSETLVLSVSWHAGLVGFLLYRELL